jgi:hypothetical protein
MVARRRPITGIHPAGGTMRLQWVRVVVVAAAVSAAGCAGRNGAKTGDGRDHGMLTKDQIVENHFNTAYDAVEALRSNWLRTRGTDSFQTPSEVLVYLDNTRLGGTDTLREIAANTIYYMRFFDGVTATGRWGVGHAAGVIYVSTHPQGMDPAPPMPAIAANANSGGGTHE